MADSDDTDILYLGLLALALIALIPGLVIHSFIVGVNVTDWWKGRSVTPVDHIVTSLGISRMCAQCAKVIFIAIGLGLRIHDFYNSWIISTVYVFFTYANFWLTSLLSVVFCLKISNLQTRLFLYLRGMITHSTVYFIIAAVLLSAFNCMMPLTIALPNLYRDNINNTIMAYLSMHCSSINYTYIYTVGAIIPLLFYVISSVLLFSSLYHHTTKMASNSSINLETYYSLMKFVSLTFIYNTLYFIGHFVCVLYYYFYCSHLTWLRIVLDVLPVLHSSYLIYRTPRLRSQMSKVLQYLSDFVSQRKVTETRESMGVVTL
ncbi:hypothetical protein GDO78_015488 [Eleutherodactylus coqui]|uniref:Taste receptor type 2 n=1 Tax=Eleutherodactylus coqui TaxID=57060 RepID=A0A8J6EDP4_ELECQ|nr:hypothetical protein GDO78_015488 [Eleutherodactylus coqui]